MKKSLLFLGVILSAGVLLSGCQKTAPERIENTSVTNEEAQENNQERVMENGATVTTTQSQTSTGSGSMQEQSTTTKMTTKNFSFSVKEMTVSKGANVTVELTNEEGVHDFVIDELGVTSGMLPTGEPVSITIPTDKPGTYEYYCSVGSHRKMGMVGTLTITE